jgi:hypothetical protein
MRRDDRGRRVHGKVVPGDKAATKASQLLPPEYGDSSELMKRVKEFHVKFG